MGIRFLCYHCEKRLNVKENQAGLQGRCPRCSGVVTIPAKSTIPSAQEKQKQNSRSPGESAKSDSFVGLHSVDDQVTLDGLPAETQQAKETTNSATKRKVVEKPKLSESSSAEMFLLTKPELPENLGEVDPIAEAPKKVWYFRSRDLGEKGPLKGKKMQEHVDRGDVKVGCIVWREDWEDWVAAEKVFPSLVLAAQTRRAKTRTRRAFKDANYQIPDELNPHSELMKRHRKHVWVFRSLIALGLVIIFVLIFVLLQLVSQ